jgi:predicted dehydrogenase
VTALGVAVIGLGVGEQHAKGFLRAGCALRWIHDLDRAKSEEVLARLGQGAIAPSFEAILDDPRVDVVALATYDDHHAAAVVQALAAGKHVFCEKPICRTAAELARIDEAWQKSGKHLGSNLVLRSAPLYQRVQSLVAAGSLGEIYAFYGDYLYGRLSKITEGWRASVDDYSVMQGGGVHLVDLMCWITGQRPSSVYSAGNRIATTGTKFRYQDFVASTFRCGEGMTAVISANFASVHRHQHVVRVFGTKGTFLYDDMGARIYRERDPGGPPEILTESALPSSKGDLIPDFLEGIGAPERGQARTALDLRVIRACLAADDALASGIPRAIDPK